MGGLKIRQREEGALPETLGVAALLATLLAIGAVTLLAQNRLAAGAQREHQRAAQSLARTLADVLGGAPSDESTRQTLLQSMGRDRACRMRWTRASGEVQFSDPAAAGEARLSGAITVSAPVRNAAGEQDGTLTLDYVPSPTVSGTAALWWGGVVAMGFATLGYLVIYWRLRRALRPLSAIQSNLRAYASGVEQELAALQLSDAFGMLGRAWNQLLGETSALKRQMERSGKGGASNDVLSRFEGRTLRRLLDRLPFGVLRVDAARNVAYANAAAAQLLGRAGQDLSGRALEELLADSQAAAALAESNAAGGLSGVGPRSGGTVDLEVKVGDSRNWVRVAAAALDVDGRHGETLVTVQDISHLREAERSRDNFLYHVTHELRTPLTNIQAYAETLSRPDFDDEQTRAECYNVILSETRRLSGLIEDILSVSQLEVGTARVEFGDVDLARMLRQMVQDNLAAADEKGVELTLKMPPRTPKLRGDKQRLSVMINNLIGNAIKYTPQGGRVAVTLEIAENVARIVVSDTGIGIDPADQPHVFEKFYRASSATTAEIPGTGLGLAIAREVARVHGGDIRLESDLGNGSTFTITLPLAGDAPAAGGWATASAAGATSAGGEASRGETPRAAAPAVAGPEATATVTAASWSGAPRPRSDES